MHGFGQWSRGALVAVALLGAPLVASAQTRTYTLTFAPEAAGATGSGTGLITLTGNLLRLQASWSGLSGTTTNSHIHCCTALPLTGTVGVATRLPTFVGFPAGVTAGSFDRTYDLLLNQEVGAPANAFWNPAFVTGSPGGTTAGAAARLIANMDAGHAYWNIHTGTFPGGEIRAFAIVTPEPSSYLLMGSGLAALGGIGWRRRRTA